MDGNKGYHGMRVLYLPFLLDQYPLGNHSLYPPPPTQLPILYQNFSKPLWDVISYMVSNVPLPTPGKDLVLFAIENCMLSCLDVDNLLKLLTAVLLERRILLCSNKYLSEPCRDNKLFKRRNQI
uniref:cDENN domain-containing protein n=1 Tax=Salix viminalis TaxID=40686 RepID=A0A6N2M215_SALVM